MCLCLSWSLAHHHRNMNHEVNCFIQILLTASVWEMLCDFKNTEVGVKSCFEGFPQKPELLCTPVMVIWVKNYKEIWKKEPLSHVLSCQAYACDVMWCMWCHIQSISEYIDLTTTMPIFGISALITDMSDIWTRNESARSHAHFRTLSLSDLASVACSNFLLKAILLMLPSCDYIRIINRKYD